MIYNNPSVIDRKHLKNQIPDATPLTPRRTCAACRKHKSIAQFWDKNQENKFKYCKTCRGE